VTGVRLGRPRTGADTEKKVLDLLGRGTGVRATARLAGVAVGTVRRIRREVSQLGRVSVGSAR
jgi:transposase-like protein